jgi:hypothetical protein
MCELAFKLSQRQESLNKLETAYSGTKGLQGEKDCPLNFSGPFPLLNCGCPGDTVQNVLLVSTEGPSSY